MQIPTRENRPRRERGMRVRQRASAVERRLKVCLVDPIKRRQHRGDRLHGERRVEPLPERVDIKEREIKPKP